MHQCLPLMMCSCIFSLREYDPDATMTSRFGKTYSRKGGEGTSKFDEVLATKRGTLSTKWGDTTYKAKVSSKRVGTPKSDSVLAGNKRPRSSDPGLDDPFGFDSDEESKPVSSRIGNKSSPAKPASAEPPQAERPHGCVGTGSRSNLQGTFTALASAKGPSWRLNDRDQTRLLEDTSGFLNSSTGIDTPTARIFVSVAVNRGDLLWLHKAFSKCGSFFKTS